MARLGPQVCAGIQRLAVKATAVFTAAAAVAQAVAASVCSASSCVAAYSVHVPCCCMNMGCGSVLGKVAVRHMLRGPPHTSLVPCYK